MLLVFNAGAGSGMRESGVKQDSVSLPKKRRPGKESCAGDKPEPQITLFVRFPFVGH
jgi:hypothetical protein